MKYSIKTRIFKQENRECTETFCFFDGWQEKTNKSGG